MQRSVKQIMKRLLCGVACLLLLPGIMLPRVAQAEQGDTVSVAYIGYHNLITQADDGSHTGYAADYLAKIAEYTGWDYEFVQMDWPAAWEAVKEGRVDFYCAARQTEEWQADFDFSLYWVCNEEMNLYTLRDSDIYYEDYAAFDGMKIGMLKSSGEIDYFEQYAKANGFDYELVEYPLSEVAAEALRNGEVDAIALANYWAAADFKLVGNFGVYPAYMMSRDGSPYMEEFSRAQEQLYYEDHEFGHTLEQAYHGNNRQYADLLLTREEADFIASAGPMTAALSLDMAPIEYFDEDTQSFKGVTVDLYNRISELTGLTVNFARRGDAPALIAQMEHGEIQLVGAMAQSGNVAQALRLTQTKAFSENSMSIVTKSVSDLSSDSVVAIPAGYPQFVATAHSGGYTNIEEYESFEECVRAVYSGAADLTYIISMCEGYLLAHAQYTELRSMVSSGTDYGICFGVSATCDPRLLSIINKAIAGIPAREINDIIVTNTASAQPKQSFSDFIAKNGLMILGVTALIIALIAFALLRSQKAKQQEMLNKRLRAHHDFLEHLYNTLPCGVFQYAYEAPHNILNYNAACAKIYGYDGEFRDH